MGIEQDLLTLKSQGERLNNLRVETATKVKLLEQEGEKLLTETQALNLPPTADKIKEILDAEEAAVQAETTRLSTEFTRILDEVSRI
ncbi:MAG: hypothetical protein ACREBR_05320 [bacterium]